MDFDFSKIQSEYIMLTDGDLISENKNIDWLQEEINILENHNDVFCVSIELSLNNLPTKHFPESINWVPRPREHKDYYEGFTGIHYCLFRKKEFFNLTNYTINNDLNYIDGEFHNYCKNILNKKWARTKKAKAIHLTWDNYSNPDDEYFQFKNSKTLEEHWNHSKYCDYKIYK